jgi:putative salt-induced outer membrane protein YdiY
MKLRIILLFLLLSIPTWGQVNTEKMRLGLSESGFAGDVNVTYSVTLGNSELTKIGLGPNFIWRLGRSQLFMLSDLNRVYSKDGTIINKAFSHLRYNCDLTDRYIYEFFLQAQYNRTQNLQHRYLIGSGIRIVPFREKSFMTAIGITGMYEDEELSSGETSKIARGSSYIFVKVNRADLLSFINTVYIQPALDNWEDFRILDEAELSVWIIKDLALTTALSYNYDSEPPEGIKHYDLELKNGLKFSFSLR